MYEAHFGLRKRPFRPTPDSDSYYPATGQERALEQLLHGLTDDEGILLVTGEPGTGKTLLCHCLLERLGENITTAFLTHSRAETRSGLLQAILYDLGQPYEGKSEQELRIALTEFLLGNFAGGRRTVILIDEAHDLTPDLLEELRQLANLEARAARPVQVVLVAQPAILERLRLPSLRGLSQRIAVRAGLEPLSFEEAADYLIHQVRTAGGRAESILTTEALELIARGTRGVPRLLNQAAHLAFTLAHAAEATTVDAEAVTEALASLGLSETAEETEEAAGNDITVSSATCRLFNASRHPA